MERRPKAAVGEERCASYLKYACSRVGSHDLISYIDEEEERKKKEMKEAARKELEDWYKHHKETIEKTRSANRLVIYISLSFNALSIFTL